MSKRTLAILLIILGGLAVIGILIWTFYPIYQQRQATQPPALPSQNTAAQFTATGTQNTVPKPNQPPKTNASSTEPTEQIAQDQLKQRSLTLAGRIGSYSNVDQFEGLRTVMLEANPAVQKYLTAERADLIKAHPAQTGSWSQTTRPLSARITSGMPITKATSATVVVQAQVTIQDSTIAQPIVNYQEFTLQLEHSGDQWLLSHIDQQPLNQ